MVNFDVLADRLLSSEALLIITGAGMGVDSGFATFRGEDGLWPKLEERLGVSYLEWATPSVWEDDPELAWGFYGTRLVNYRSTEPHEGYRILRKWRDDLFGEGDSFFFTTNVDGHTLRAFPEDEVIEQHGTLLWGQKTDRSGGHYPLHDHRFDIDPETVRCSSETLPRDEDGNPLRASVLLFDDWLWNRKRHDAQKSRYYQWKYAKGRNKVFILEIGCGDVITTGRYEAMIMKTSFPTTTHVRINPCDTDWGPSSPPRFTTSLRGR